MTTLPPFASLSTASKRITAEMYARRLGMAAFPVIGKEPADKARHWRDFTASKGVYGKDDRAWQAATGYALAPTNGSAVVVIDCDDPEFTAELLKQVHNLKFTFRVDRGTHTHFYVELDRPLQRSILNRNGPDGHQQASIRAKGAYVVGPGSDHPTGERYTPANNQAVFKLGKHMTDALLDLFKPQPLALTAQPTPVKKIEYVTDGIKAIPHWSTSNAAGASPAVIAILDSRGYRRNGDWLNGPCIHPENHTHADEHASFGVNVTSGVGNCFKCGSMSPAHVAAQLGIECPAIHSPKSYTFAQTDKPAVLDESAVQVELNIAVEFNRRGKNRAGRLYALIAHSARQMNGQAVYRITDLLDLARSYGLTKSQVYKAIKELVSLGIIVKRQPGVYQRVSVESVQRGLGIEANYALVTLPRRAFAGTIGAYNLAITIQVGRHLPQAQSAKAIAAAASVSPSTLYRHEKRAGVARKTVTNRVGLASATGQARFAKVFNADGQHIQTVSIRPTSNGLHHAIRTSIEVGGSAWAWNQRPSRRNWASAVLGDV